MVDRMTVEENVALGRQDKPPFARRALIDFRGRRGRAGKLLADFDVRPPDPRARIGQLSGGNQQKVVVARELDSNPRLLIVVQPTRGLDFAATNLVHQRLRDARRRGAGIILISLDLDELFQLSDRIYVLFGGAITAEMGRSDFDQKRIGSLMLGGRGEDQALGAPH
jgi:simple sugar transport system ATP-binding protein